MITSGLSRERLRGFRPFAVKCLRRPFGAAAKLADQPGGVDQEERQEVSGKSAKPLSGRSPVPGEAWRPAPPPACSPKAEPSSGASMEWCVDVGVGHHPRQFRQRRVGPDAADVRRYVLADLAVGRILHLLPVGQDIVGHQANRYAAAARCGLRHLGNPVVATHHPQGSRPIIIQDRNTPNCRKPNDWARVSSRAGSCRRLPAAAPLSLKGADKEPTGGGAARRCLSPVPCLTCRHEDERNLIWRDAMKTPLAFEKRSSVALRAQTAEELKTPNPLSLRERATIRDGRRRSRGPDRRTE